MSPRFGPRPRPAAQSGVALLTVLLLVAVMTVLVMGMLDDIRFGVRRAGNAQAMAQAQRYALGAEDVAMAQIRRLDRLGGGRTTLAGGWNGKATAFPVEHGAIEARLYDAGNCFNLNSVVEGATEQWQRRELGARQYLALLSELGVDGQRAQVLVDALVDWIDSDQARSPLGAEDASYGTRRTAYRTGGTLLAEVTELRAIEGYDAATYARLRPYVCALPENALSPLNPNTLQEQDAPLLAMLTLGAVQGAAARRAIAGRPNAGWIDLAAFWRAPALAGADLPVEVKTQPALRTRYFGLDTRIEYDSAQLVLSALIRNDAGNPRLVARRLTREE